jgi:hypothetical protein
VSFESESALNHIVDCRGEQWSRKRQRNAKDLRYRAALIVRNVRYREWDVRTVELELRQILEGAEKIHAFEKRSKEAMKRAKERK